VTPRASHPRLATRALALTLGLALAAPTAHAQAPAYPQDSDRRTDIPQDRGPLQVDGRPLADELPPELVLPPVAAMLQAQRLARAGDHLAAALLFESLWAASDDLRLGYHAARERSLAGHHALALRHFLRVLERAAALPESVRVHLAAHTTRERAQTRQVRLRLVEAVPGGVQDLPTNTITGARLILESAPEPGDQRFTQGLVLGEPLALDPGPWILRLEVPGYVPIAVQQTVDPAAGEPTWTLEFERPQVSVLLRFSPPKAGPPMNVRLVATDRSPPPVFEQVAMSPTLRMIVTSGAWRLEVDTTRYQARQDLTLTPQSGPIDVLLGKRPRSAAPRFNRDRKLALGVLAGFGFSYLVGISLILGGSSRENRVEKRNNELLTAEGLDPEENRPPDPAALARIEAVYATADYHRDLRISSGLGMAGVQVSIGGLGAAVAVIPVVLGARKRAAYIELGVGAAFLAGGSVWLASYLKNRAAALAPDARRITKSELDDLSLRQLGASMITSVGVGMVTFSALALIVDAAKRRKADRQRFTLDPGPGPGQVGGSLIARF
jgi:hypothetical protein